MTPELERKNNASATVRREQYIARKKRERTMAVAKSDGDMNSKWFSNLGSWFSKKNRGQAGTVTPRSVVIRDRVRDLTEWAANQKQVRRAARLVSPWRFRRCECRPLPRRQRNGR